MVRARIIVAEFLSVVIVLAALSCGGSGLAREFKTDVDVMPAEDTIGERLFLDTRFAEYFAVHMTGVNQPLAAGDPVAQQVQTTSGPLTGPFAGKSINCRSCHFVTEFQNVPGAGNRTYSDFTTRSPIPRPIDGFTTTPRNAMHMVGSLQPHEGRAFLHFDGKFASPENLVAKCICTYMGGLLFKQDDFGRYIGSPYEVFLRINHLPATPTHPNALEPFRRAADPAHPEYTDLGLWNIYLNPDIPNPQADLKAFLCGNGQDCSVDQGVGRTIARFKTPTLRDLEDSDPYFHNGSAQTFGDVIEFYINSPQLARQGLLRNPPSEFKSMSISTQDIDALKAFLKSLTEDYDDT